VRTTIRHCIVLLTALLASAAGARSQGIEVTVTPPNPTATTPVTLTVCKEFPDSCYAYRSSAWTFTSPFTISARLNVNDHHRPEYFCATVMTLVCGQYQLGSLKPGRYRVYATVNTVCVYENSFPFCLPSSRTAAVCFDVGPASSIWEAKRSLPGTFCSIGGSTVTAAFPHGFYIQAAPGGPGLLVRQANHGIAASTRVDVQGHTAVTDGGEKCVDATMVRATGSAFIGPAFVSTTDVGGDDWLVECSPGTGQPGVRGGSGLNNIGLCAAVAGRVTHADPAGGFFTIWDGAHTALAPVRDSDGHAGVRVSAPGCPMPQTGSFAVVEGVVSCTMAGGERYPLLLANPEGVSIAE